MTEPDWKARAQAAEARTEAMRMALEEAERWVVVWRDRHIEDSAHNETMRRALERIERWFGEFPETGKTWEGSGEPMSYAACYGSTGERDFMRSVARAALSAFPGGEGRGSSSAALPSAVCPGRPDTPSPAGGWAEGPFHFTDALHHVEWLLLPAKLGARGKDDETGIQEAELYVLEARAFLEKQRPAESEQC